MTPTEWSHMDKQRCPCKGSGWAMVSKELWKECFIHFEGQIHPETRALLLDEPNRLAEEERTSGIKFQIKQLRSQNIDLQMQLKNNQSKIVALELELINRTPTIRIMPAVLIEKDENDWSDLNI